MRDSDRETVAAFDALLAMERDGGRRAILTEKREVYAKRADKLERLALDVTPKPPTPSPPSPPSPKPLNPLPTPASNELDDLTAEIENLLSRMKVVKEKWEKKALGQKVEALLARAEKLKGPVDVVSPAKPPVKPTSKPTAKPASPTRSSSASTLAVRPSPGKPSPTRSSPTSNSLSPSQSIPSLSNLLTASEIAVLRDSSRINGLLLLPWAEEDPLSLHSPDNLPAFLDPSGPLPLSAAQKTNFGSWKRPHEWLSEPILAPSAEELLAETRQETVTDCTLISPLLSMLSLLAIRNAPIPPILHPQSYSSHGKYLARLYLNGIPRTLEIDDLLPFSREAGPMFTHTPGSLWISLLEKAWMKVHGGYGYPGSGASSDFYGLLGWIPEEVYVGKHLLDDDKPDTDDLWTRILRGWKEGVCVLTAATGPNADKGSGLVPSHAYAILDLREGAGERLVKLKNPWRRKRWTGALSPSDGESWNAELWQLCGYDLWAAQESDDGIFWIRWGDLIKHFDSIHMNWDPEMFPHKWTGHLRWVPEQAGNPEVLLSENPQFEVQSSGEGWIWAFLGKHVTELVGCSLRERRREGRQG